MLCEECLMVPSAERGLDVLPPESKVRREVRKFGLLAGRNEGLVVLRPLLFRLRAAENGSGKA
jgi:hypothetical protein